jgi:rubrerythrin
MAKTTSIDILKEAFLLEQRGRSFYLKVASQASNGPIAEFFETMAEEESRHMQVLELQMQSIAGGHGWKDHDADDGVALSDQVLTDEVRSQIAAADFEAAAISAAILMEEKAIALYGRRAQEAQDPNEKKLFQWLSDWEKGHLTFLADLDRDIKARIWNDNQFWPF